MVNKNRTLLTHALCHLHNTAADDADGLHIGYLTPSDAV